MSEMETMLRTAMQSRRTEIDKATGELTNTVALMNKAVQSVSKGVASLELQTLKNRRHNQARSLNFRVGNEETIIRIFTMSELGYPMCCFKSLEDYDLFYSEYETATNLFHVIDNAHELMEELSPLLSDPTSHLIRLLDYYTERDEGDIPF